MADRIVTLRELNRATLARQMLLEREKVTVPAAIERLAGLQAQLSAAPFVGLWSRLRDFSREDLARTFAERSVVKATFLRATLHLVTADDYVRFRGLLQPMLSEGWSRTAKKREAGFDLDRLLADARRFIAEKPRTFAAISEWLAELMPGYDVGAMRYGVRTHLPLVQVPASGAWSYPGNPEFTLAEPWIGRQIAPAGGLRDLVFRYLAAYGPAAATDMQTWSGLAKLKDAFEALRPELQVLRGEGRRELFDLPGQPLPEGDAPAPVRFLPEFDNLLLAHSQRTRIIADEHRAKVFLPGLRVRATILVDGFVRGGWSIEETKTAAALMIEPFEKLTRQDRAALSDEGERLVRFVEPKAKSFEVRFA